VKGGDPRGGPLLISYQGPEKISGRLAGLEGGGNGSNRAGKQGEVTGRREGTRGLWNGNRFPPAQAYWRFVELLYRKNGPA